MKTALSVAGMISIMMGGVWFLQGINVLPGSFMTGQIRWAIYGGIAVVVGIVLLIAANRRRASNSVSDEVSGHWKRALLRLICCRSLQIASLLDPAKARIARLPRLTGLLYAELT